MKENRNDLGQNINDPEKKHIINDSNIDQLLYQNIDILYQIIIIIPNKSINFKNIQKIQVKNR